MEVGGERRGGEEDDGGKDGGEDAESWDVGKKFDLADHKRSHVVLHPCAAIDES